MDFSQSFRYFVDMTNAKFVEMAEEMSLDRSNFSKWYNDKGLPNEDLWGFIRKKMVKYFSERMISLIKLNELNEIRRVKALQY